MNFDLKIMLGTIAHKEFFDKYKILEQIGKGTFSMTYKIQEKQSQNIYCLKVITKNENYFHQSLIEVKLLEYLNNNNTKNCNYCFKIYDKLYLNGNLYIITELLGDSLYQKFIKERQKFSIKQLKNWTKDILLNLKFLKDNSIMHCDLKPENIVLDNQKNIAKIIDFGSACFIDDNSEFYLQTRAYRAPEVLLGLSYDFQIDIWSLGCILFELISGQNLFDYDCSLKNIIKAMAIQNMFDISIFKLGQKFEEFTFNSKFFFIQGDNNEKLLLIGKQQKQNFFNSISKNKDLNDFIEKCLQINPQKRMNVEQALKHSFLK